MTARAKSHDRAWLIRVTGSFAALGIVFLILPFETVATALASISPAIFLAVLALFLIAHVAAALKWRALLGAQMPIPLAIKAHFAGLAANLCLPGAIGGDAVRAAMADKAVQNRPHLAAVAIVDRLIDMFALVSLAIIGLLLSQVGETTTSIALQTIACIVIFGLGFVLMPKFLMMPWKLIPALPARGIAEKLSGAISDMNGKPGLLARTFILSLAIQATLVGLSWWLARGVASDVSLGHWLFAWPLAKLIAVVPISLNGLGLREAALASILTPLGGEAALIVAAGLVWQAVLFVAGGIGALVIFVSKLSGRPTTGRILEKPATQTRL